MAKVIAWLLLGVALSFGIGWTVGTHPPNWWTVPLFIWLLIGVGVSVAMAILAFTEAE